MTKVLQLPRQTAHAEPPRRKMIKRHSALLATALAWTFSITLCAAALLMATALFYQGDAVSFGPGGLWIGYGPDATLGRVSLTTLSITQRFAGVFAIAILATPVMIVLHCMRRLFDLYADGVVFTPANARFIKFMAAGLVSYAFAPFAAHHAIAFAGLTNDPIWFHADEVLALVFGALAYVVADVMEFGHEIERDRDGFV